MSTTVVAPQQAESAGTPPRHARSATWLSTGERRALGKAARATTPRASHATWTPAPARANPVDLLEEQAASRVPELVPIRYGRMAASPFAFFRGAAYVMAADLAHTPTSGLRAQLCGDAHLANFGGFASPERDLVFDINDFDETLPGPWEFDVKRLMASLAIAARARGFSPQQRRSIVLEATHEYRTVMAALAEMSHLDVWYSRLNADDVRARFGRYIGARGLERFNKRIASAKSRDSIAAYRKLTREVDGEVRIASQPPLIVALDDLLPGSERIVFENAIVALLRAYRRSLPDDRRHLLEKYRYVHLARKVVGVGSVGTRAWVALLLGAETEDPLFLQIKEAQASVHERFVGRSLYSNHGQRVVEGQRLIQAASDIFLGWFRAKETLDGQIRDFYVRQLWDWKVSADIETQPVEMMTIYGIMCGGQLARAHARSGDRFALAAYLGRSDTFDRALAAFAEAYADQTERDHAMLVDAVRSGRITAVDG